MSSVIVDTSERPELFFALVGAAGSRLADLSSELRAALAGFGYSSVDIRLSDLLSNFTGWSPPDRSTEAARIMHLQEMGNSFRRALGRGGALARASIAAIRNERMKRSGGPDRPAAACAYILHQLKHPAEVDLLREVYGPSFLLVAGHAPHEKRVDDLAIRMARKEAQPGHERQYRGDAERVIEIDEKQDDDLGQNTRDTYPKADFFANLGLPKGDPWAEATIRRFVDLLFGHPFHTPLPEEYVMYLASAVALRSSDDNRQVGAVVAKIAIGSGRNIKEAEVIAGGMNEVPRRGGGYYGENESPDARDQSLLYFHSEDRAREIKVSALSELLGKIRQKQWLCEEIVARPDNELAGALLDGLKGTQFMDIGEFSRPVHAEMAALIDAARRGVPVNGHSLYVTTFPCHNCAKHIIAAGIQRVVYLEPYPKSRAGSLHREEIDLQSVDGNTHDGKVAFLAFSGIAPRQYRPLFLMSERGAKKGNSLQSWCAAKTKLPPLCPPRSAWRAYLAAEREELAALPQEIYRWNKELLSPAPQPYSPDPS